MYSADGTQVTLYLDGVGVPVTQSQRKLTLDMAKMAHDFYEVVFFTWNPNVIVGATWEIGQSAGVKGVYRGLNPEDGLSYLPSLYSSAIHATGNRGAVLLFAGRKVDKTLLAIGLLSHINGIPGILGNANSFIISSSTKSITFTLYHIETKLDIVTDSDNDTSFRTASGQGAPYNTPNAINTKANNMAEYVSLGGVKYPYYKLPKNASVQARYRFFISSSFPLPYNFFNYIKIVNQGSIKAEVIKREPRFLSGGRYYYVQAAKLDTGTTVKFDLTPSFVPDDSGNFEHNGIALFVFEDDRGLCFIFDTGESQGGIFSFTFRFPVCNFVSRSDNSSTAWYLQLGFGKELYSLDNGVDAGGCILMGTEDFSDDWMDIFTAGMPW